MKKIIHIFLSSALFMMLSSCGQDLKQEIDNIAIKYEAVKSELDVNETSISIDGTEQTVRLSVTCNSYWTADTKSSWLNLETYSGRGNTTLAIKANSNPSTLAERKDVVNVTDGIKTIPITITQAPSKEVLTLSVNSLNFKYQSDYSTVSVTASSSWSVSSDASWCVAEKYNSGYIYVQVDNNNSYSSRTATVTVKGNAVSTTLKVNQAGAEVPTLGKLTIYNLTKTSADCQFTYSSPNVAVQRSGVLYSAKKEPTTDDDNLYSNTTSSNYYSGTSKHGMTNLKQNTIYYVRPYVITSLGTTYGETESFTTLKSNSPDDDDNPTPTY